MSTMPTFFNGSDTRFHARHQQRDGAGAGGEDLDL